MLQGKFNEARTEYALEPEAWERLTGEAIVFQRLGDTKRARAAMQSLIATRGNSMAYQQAQVLAQWGDAKGALAALAVAFRVGDSGLILMKSDRLMDPLQKLPAFQAMLARLGLGG